MADELVERVISAPTAPGAAARIQLTPSQLYFDGNMNLRLEGWNSLANTQLQLHGLFLREDGTMKWFSKTLPLAATRTRGAADIPMDRGFMVNLVCVAAGAAPRIGETFARVTITLGLTGATLVLGTLLQGYVTAAQGIAWPGSPIRSSVDGPGAMKYAEVGPSPPGSELQVVQPTGVRWRPVSLFTRLVTSAVVATRIPMLEIARPTGAEIARVPTTGSQAASLDRFYTWGIGLGGAVAAGSTHFTGALPDGVALNDASFLRTVTLGLDAGDQWNGLTYLVEEWLEVN